MADGATAQVGAILIGVAATGAVAGVTEAGALALAGVMVPGAILTEDGAGAAAGVTHITAATGVAAGAGVTTITTAAATTGTHALQHTIMVAGILSATEDIPTEAGMPIQMAEGTPAGMPTHDTPTHDTQIHVPYQEASTATTAT